MQAFAFEVYRRFLNGQTLQQLSAELGVPADRIEQRLRAAARHRECRQSTPQHTAVRFAEESLLRWARR